MCAIMTAFASFFGLRFGSESQISAKICLLVVDFLAFWEVFIAVTNEEKVYLKNQFSDIKIKYLSFRLNG